MGMLSRAMKNRKEKMQEELGNSIEEREERANLVTSVIFPDDLARALNEMSRMRGISVEQMAITQLTAVANAYQNQKILRLQDYMPYGKYRGIMVEDMIRSDPRYVNWLASESVIFVLDEAGTALLKELS